MYQAEEGSVIEVCARAAELVARTLGRNVTVRVNSEDGTATGIVHGRGLACALIRIIIASGLILLY